MAPPQIIASQMVAQHMASAPHVAAPHIPSPFLPPAVGRPPPVEPPPSTERAPSVGLHGYTRKQAQGARLRVYYNEDGASVPYGGVCESIDMKRGIRVKLDGYSKREWVTDDDEWEWEKPSAPLAGPRPVEFVVGPVQLREVLARLLKSKESCATAAKGEHMPGQAPKAGGKRGAGGGRAKNADGEPKRRKKQGVAEDGGEQPAAAGGEAKPSGRGAAARKRKAEEAASLAAAGDEAGTNAPLQEAVAAGTGSPMEGAHAQGAAVIAAAPAPAMPSDSLLAGEPAL